MISRGRCGIVDAWLGLGTRLLRPLELDGVDGAMTRSGGDVWSEMVNRQLILGCTLSYFYMLMRWVEIDVDILVSWGSHTCLRQPRYTQLANTIQCQEVKAVKDTFDSVATGFKYAFWEYPEDSMKYGCRARLLLAVLVHHRGRCDTFTPRR